jgi:hypothetical protein
VLIGFQDRRGVKRDATASGVMRSVHPHNARNESWGRMSPTAGRVVLVQFGRKMLWPGVAYWSPSFFA